MITEESENLKIESGENFPELLESNAKRLHQDILCHENDLIAKETSEELCQCFQTIQSLMNYTSPIRSASSDVTLTSRRIIRSITCICAKQTTDSSVFIRKNDDHESSSTELTPATSTGLIRSPSKLSSTVTNQTINVLIEEKSVSSSNESIFVWRSNTEENQHVERQQISSNKTQYRPFKSYRSLDLSTIHETSLESDTIVKSQTGHSTNSDDKFQLESIRKRQPLQEFDINSFNDDERKIKNEKNLFENSIVFKLPSDTDQENLPITLKKRSIALPIYESTNKKYKRKQI
ncbi:unnamed protein product [Rotaria socialis]|uniref:Uncharacterized protein n=1 Tax=Rotaria socialis TaxID=392032 RepID=A0A820SX46_9BILA|nr:unnamed protein product [Rotaria socialis]CAF4465323.1 unnamed protein product [Rotaria socialis]